MSSISTSRAAGLARHFVPGLALLAALAGCTPSGPSAPPEPQLGGEIETAADGRCYGRDIAPAVIETQTAHDLVAPESRGQDGALVSPATYQTVTRQVIVRERQEVAFETLCPPAYSASFVASLQRALLARGYYRGAPDGILDDATRRAIQDFQRGAGPDSPLLSLAAARRLGLVALSAEELERM